MFDKFPFKQVASKIELPKNHNYLVSYPKFLAHFKEPKKLTPSDVVFGGNLVYGWMPTTFKLKDDYLSSISKATDYLNLARQGRILTKHELVTVKKVINNSIVGTSKLLHFLNPSYYPIWDSKICKVTFGTKSYSTVSKVQNYVEYQKICLKLVDSKHFNEPHKIVQSALSEAKYDYKITKIRALEMILFYSSQS